VTAVLQVEGLRKSFGGVQAVADVSFAVDAGELLALIGPNPMRASCASRAATSSA
jgi:branched-chain amino acid transport system ATP-binding protein